VSTTIFYFSGTGNSLKVSKDIANKLGDTEIISIPSILNKEKISVKSERIGIVFPVYIYGVPLVLSRFIDKLDEACKDKYFFAIATYKSQPGGALLLLKRRLNARGINLSAGFNICMPGNNIVFYETDSTDKQNEKFLLLRKRLNEIVPIIKNKNHTKIERGNFVQRILGTKILYKVISKSFRISDKQYWVDDKCAGCGICEKICPVQNISIEIGKPLWHHRCELCMACLNLCPNQAIQYKNITINKLRYKNPYIEVKELYK
jgi:ferredoxin